MKIGIEIHQRLDGKKLFCNCACAISDSELPKLTLNRRLHPVFSELGEIDRASQAEFSKGRTFTYQAFTSNNCLVELDEEPPKTANIEALKTALNIALQLNCFPVHELHVMRKMVIDGSNTSGFQRTAIIAVNGHLDTSKGTVNIPLVAIEEESAGIVSNTESSATYRLDRLGIPLIEISTSPDIKDGEHLVEVAEKIGLLMRATGKVARGIGTIRQDVNISTEGGARIEIKGAQDLKMLPDLVTNEVKRQTELVKLLSELRSRKALPLKFNPIDLTYVFKGTKASIIAKGLASSSSVIGQKLSVHKGLLGREIQPGRRYGTELSDYAKLAGVKGIIHSDESMDKYGFTAAEVQLVMDALAMHKDSNDAFVLVVAPKQQAENAIEKTVARANMDFVPEETRRANPDGTSSFMRPLPGKARLYPETDIPPLLVTKDLIDSIDVGESLAEKQKKLEKLLHKDLVLRILKSRNLHLFEKLVQESGRDVDPTLIATTLEETVVALRREGVEFSDLDKVLHNLFAEYTKGLFVKAAIPEILKGMAKGASVESVIKVFRLQKISGQALEKIVAGENYDLKVIMQKYRLQVDPGEVAALVKKASKHPKLQTKEKHSEYL